MIIVENIFVLFHFVKIFTKRRTFNISSAALLREHILHKIWLSQHLVFHILVQKIKMATKNGLTKSKWQHKSNFKNLNYHQKSKWLLKIKIAAKIQNAAKNQNSCQKPILTSSTIWAISATKIQNAAKNQNSCQKTNFDKLDYLGYLCYPD